MTTNTVSPLRQRMIEDMNARKLCAGTQRGHNRSWSNWTVKIAARTKACPAVVSNWYFENGNSSRLVTDRTPRTRRQPFASPKALAAG